MTSLPLEVLLEIVKWLSLEERMTHFAPVCRDFMPSYMILVFSEQLTLMLNLPFVCLIHYLQGTLGIYVI